jgi:hypothetical protein
MARWLATLLGVMAAAGAGTAAQDVPLEYQVKAAYLLNFTRFVEWPAPAAPGSPLTICMARTNPFGAFLASTIAGETVAGRPLGSRVVSLPDASCGVLFVPSGVAAEPMLRAIGNAPVLTVGDSPDFLQRGGMIAFVLDGGRVRFAINPAVAEQHHLLISSRLLQLALRPVGGGSR